MHVNTDGASDVFALKLDAAGGYLWSRSLGGEHPQDARALATDAHGAVYLMGTFRDALDLGGGPLVSVGPYDAFATKLAP